MTKTITLEGLDYCSLVSERLNKINRPKGASYLAVSPMGEIALFEYEGMEFTVSPSTVEAWAGMDDEDLEAAFDAAWNDGRGVLRSWPAGQEEGDEDEPSFVPVTRD